MSMSTVGEILSWMDDFAPFSSAEEWDNVGLLVGSATHTVTTVMTALDITESVVRQAEQRGVQLIISHHPLIFRPMKRMVGESPLIHLIRHGISAIAAHTNLDKAIGGVNDVLAAQLGLQETVVTADGLCRLGILPEAMEPAAFAAYVRECVHAPSVQWAPGNRPVKTVALCSGAGGDYMSSCLSQADAFVTGELHYHEWPSETEQTIVAAGHFYTEVIFAQALADRLQKAFPSLTVFAAEETCPYQG